MWRYHGELPGEPANALKDEIQRQLAVAYRLDTQPTIRRSWAG